MIEPAALCSSASAGPKIPEHLPHLIGSVINLIALWCWAEGWVNLAFSKMIDVDD